MKYRLIDPFKFGKSKNINKTKAKASEIIDLKKATIKKQIKSKSFFKLSKFYEKPKK